MTISKELVGATFRPLVLSLLSDGDSYGYDIIQRMKQESEGKLVWKDGSLYPVLHRMEDEGTIASYWVTTDAGRRRKYYRITDDGVRQLDQEKMQWIHMDSIFTRLWDLPPRMTPAGA